MAIKEKKDILLNVNKNVHFYLVLYVYYFSRKIPTYTFIQSYTFISF